MLYDPLQNAKTKLCRALKADPTAFGTDDMDTLVDRVLLALGSAQKLLEELVDEGSTEYYSEEDEVGHCRYCHKEDGKDHLSDCVFGKAKRFVLAQKQN